MSSFLRHGTLLLAALAAPVLSSPLLDDRAVCNRNNLVRCLDPTGTKPVDIASRSAATAYCSSFLSIPVVTSTIATTTPITFTTTSVTIVDSTQVVTTTATSVITIPEEATTTVTARAKRAISPVVAPPVCVTKGITYADASITAACACLSVSPSTTYVTATAPTSTSVIITEIHETTTTTTGTTTITTTTSTATTTITEPAAPPPPRCAGDLINLQDGRIFCHLSGASVAYQPQYYSGNEVFGGVASYPACLQRCIAARGRECLAIAYNNRYLNCVALYGQLSEPIPNVAIQQDAAVADFDTAYWVR
ncbi:hypothetical protein GE09DRAFT_1230132 [Coniochaeta sp. 2T2.1]|nr:hypothetical protein GE09DRAFT_1230132 [Coniochaeta sp. 2T2.1]